MVPEPLGIVSSKLLVKSCFREATLVVHFIFLVLRELLDGHEGPTTLPQILTKPHNSTAALPQQVHLLVPARIPRKRLIQLVLILTEEGLHAGV